MFDRFATFIIIIIIAIRVFFDRSHAILILHIENRTFDRGGAGDCELRMSKLTFVDMAGTERPDSLPGGATVVNQSISGSLSAFTDVLFSLSKTANAKQQHVPYLNSKLTHLLKESLTTHSKTTIITTVLNTKTPEHLKATETSLQFASWAKAIKGHAVINPSIRLKEPDRLTSKETDPELIRFRCVLMIDSLSACMC